MQGSLKADIVYFGLRVALGTIFVAHGFEKFDPAIAAYFPQFGLPVEMAFLSGLAEFVSGILLIVGVLTRLSAALLSIVMLGAIFYVLKAASLTGQFGYEFPLILLASALVIIAVGSGRVSVSHLAKKIPRFLQ